MANDTKAAAVTEDSPELAHFKFREKELLEKQAKLDVHPGATGHDLSAASARNESALKQVRAEIKRLSK